MTTQSEIDALYNRALHYQFGVTSPYGQCYSKYPRCFDVWQHQSIVQYEHDRKNPALELFEKNTFKVGDVVKGNYNSEGCWFYGEITQVRKNGSYDIKYDNGLSEEQVFPISIIATHL